jgi:trehalose synthase
MTYELVHFSATHSAERFTFRGVDRSGEELAGLIRSELIAGLTGAAAPYNLTFTTNGIAATTASMCAAALGYCDLSALSTDQIEAITRAHLLLAMFNAWQPGVFALSGWDVCGTLTLDTELVSQLIVAGDTRWIHRAAYDLMDYQPNAVESASGMPRGASLYGPLPRQLADHTSFASRLRRIVRMRRQSGIPTAWQLSVPEVADPALLVMIHRLPSGQIQATALNFSTRPIRGRFASEHFRAGDRVIDLHQNRPIGEVGPRGNVDISLSPHGGILLVLETPGHVPGPRAATHPGV